MTVLLSVFALAFLCVLIVAIAVAIFGLAANWLLDRERDRAEREWRRQWHEDDRTQQEGRKR